jgi:hypothetical protein
MAIAVGNFIFTPVSYNDATRRKLVVSNRRLIVTHHAPDLDAIGSTWLLKRFASQDFADARIAFVNPGDTITLEAAEEYGAQLHEVTHVDTGFGEFDHHQADKAKLRVCASSLVFDYLCKLHPELAEDEALKILIEYINQIDHFEEIFWPEAKEHRPLFMIHELIKGHEQTDPHNDESQLYFGFQCLNNAYAIITQHVSAEKIIKEKGQEFMIKAGKCLAVLTSNDDTIKLAQKYGYILVIRKDPKLGAIRIKIRPDAEFDLDQLYDQIKTIDQTGTWFYHGSGKMLLNGSTKDRNQKPSPLSLEQVVEMVKGLYGNTDI